MNTQLAGNTSKTATSPRCGVVDLIIPWEEVQEGDLVLWDGELHVITRMVDWDGRPLLWFDGSKTGPGTLPRGTYAAVRRYVTEGE